LRVFIPIYNKTEWQLLLRLMDSLKGVDYVHYIRLKYIVKRFGTE
jgi:hypothetical protein